METKDVDYKEKFGDSALKAICGLANTDGGKVIIGVGDDGSVKGVNITNKNLEKISQIIANKLGLHPEIKLEDSIGKRVLIITVPKSDVPISFNGKYYERVGNTTREMKNERLKTFFLKNTNWDGIINHDADFDEIDIESVRQFIRLTRSKGRLGFFDENTDIKTIFEHLRLSINGKLTNGGIMLFGRDPQKHFQNASLRVVRLKNDTAIVGDRLITGNLFRQVIEGEEAIKQFINVRYEIEGLIRKERWDYPIDAIREALINALIHRDYHRWTVQTQIKIYDDYIWFYNTGGLPEGITLEQLKGPHPSVPRNPLLVHVFYLAGFIEEVGSGIGRMRESLQKAGLPEPEFREEMGGFSVYFRKDIYTEEYLGKLGLNERQIKAVLYVKERGQITNREYQKITETTDRTALRDLNHLCELGILKRIGTTGRRTKYILTRQKHDKHDINPTKTRQKNKEDNSDA